MTRFGIAVPPPGSREATIVHDNLLKTVYLVTVGKRPSTEGNSDGGFFLGSLAIEPQDGSPVDQDMLRRIPVQQIADAVVIKAREESRRRGTPPDTGVPTSAQIEAMLKSGENRHTIAARYSRSPSTVSDWIGRAYRERPDTMPPRRRSSKASNQATRKQSTKREQDK